MSNDNAVQISNQKVQEIFKGKAQAVIGDLMLENSKLATALESQSLELQDLRQQVAAYKQRDLSQRSVPGPTESDDFTPPGA